MNSGAACARIHWPGGTFGTLKRLNFRLQAAFWLSFGWLVAQECCFQAVFTHTLGLLTNEYLREQL
jgi:hypothetical protein